MEFLPLLIGFLLTLGGGVVGFRVKDAVAKNTFSHRITYLENTTAIQDKVNQTQEDSIARLREDNIKVSQNMLSLQEKVQVWADDQKKEVRYLKKTADETTKAIIKLEATLKAFAQLIEKKL